MQPFWSKILTVLAVDLTAIYMPWQCLQTDKHFRSSILRENTWPVLSIFFHALGHGRNWFVIQEDLLSFSLIYGFRNGLVFFWCFSKLLNWGSLKTCLIFGCFGGFCCAKNFGNFSCSFIENRYGKFYSHFGIAIKVLVLVSKIW